MPQESRRGKFPIPRQWLAALTAATLFTTTAHAQVGTGGLVFFGDRVVKESIASSAPITQIVGGGQFTAALRADGTVVAWGFNQVGQCNVPKGLTGVTQISSGVDHTLLLMKDGTVKAFGWDNYFQSDVPAGLTNVVQVAAGSYCSLALKGDGTVVGWGYNSSGQCNIPVGLPPIKQIAAGSGHVVALTTSGQVICWGSNVHNEATPPAGMGTAVSIAACYEHSGAVLANGQVAVWGNNIGGDGVVPPSLSGVTQLALGQNHCVALKSDGTVVCWGTNFWGETAPPSTAIGLKQVAASFATSYGVTTAGTIVGWGDSSYGQTVAPNNLYDVSKVSAGLAHVILLKHDGTLAAWGRNTEGQVNLPSTPGVVFTDVSAGAVHNAAVSTPIVFNGLFGLNSDGQIAFPGGVALYDGMTAYGHITCLHQKAGGVKLVGDNYYGSLNLPNTVDYKQVAGGLFTSLAIRPDGTLATAGTNNYSLMNIPAAAVNVVQIATGDTHYLALRSDGTVVAWGLNNLGQTTVPASATGVVQVAAGTEHSLVLKADGSMIGWGGNTYGQVVVPAGATGIAQISSGQNFNVCLPNVTVAVAPYKIFAGEAGSGTVYLASPSPAGGTVVNLSSSNSAATVPSFVLVPAGQTSASFQVLTSAVTSVTQPVITAALGTCSQDCLVTVAPSTFNLTSTVPSVVGGSTALPKGTVTLAAPAPVGGVTVTLTSSDSSVTVPASVFLGAGKTSKTFSILHSRVSLSTPVTITANDGQTIRTLPFTVDPFQVKTFTVSPTNVLGGGAATATVTLNATPAADVDVVMTSSDPSTASVAGTLTVPTGSNKNSVPVSTVPVAGYTGVTLTATLEGVTSQGLLKVQPALKTLTVASGTLYGNCSKTYTLTLTLPAPTGGFDISLTALNGTVPATVHIDEGATTAQFDAVADDVTVASTLKVTATCGPDKLVTDKAIAPNTLASFVVSPTTFTGSSTTVVTGTVTLKGKVAVDTTIDMTSNDPSVGFATTLVIPAGQNVGVVTLTHSAVVRATTVKVTAAHAGGAKAVSLIVYP